MRSVATGPSRGEESSGPATGGDRRRVGVIGLGGVLMGDDAAGPWTVCRLEAGWELPPEVELLDGGTPGPELSHVIGGLDALIVVDTVRRDEPPGSLVLLGRDELVAGFPAARLSPHDPSLRQALLTAELAGDAPSEVVLVGVVPETLAMGCRLSPAVHDALPQLEQAVVDELARLGVTARRRPDAPPATAWWEEKSKPLPTGC